MPDTQLLIELDGEAVSAEDLDRLLEVQVEESSEDADALTLAARVEPGIDGEWTSLLDPLGSSRSHGCVRVDDSNVRWLARVLPLGTPVRIF